MKNITTEASVHISSEKSQIDHLLIPGTLGFMSAHTLINRERILRSLPSLKRSVALDELCQQHAHDMAEKGELVHCAETSDQLRLFVNSVRAGQNIQRGPNVWEMHQEAMRAGRTAGKNILAPRFLEFGVGTALGKDGRLYMTQLFRGPEGVEG